MYAEFLNATLPLCVGKNPKLKALDEEILRLEKEIRQSERLLQVMANKEREQIMSQPERVDEILQARFDLRKETEERIDGLTNELENLYKQKEEIERLVQQKKTKQKLKKAFKAFMTKKS